MSWFKELIRDGTVRLTWVAGEDNVADIFTNILANKKFKQFRDNYYK